MEQRRLNLFLLNSLRECTILGAGLGMLLGCGTSSTPETAKNGSQLTQSASSTEIEAFSTSKPQKTSKPPLFAPGHNPINTSLLNAPAAIVADAPIKPKTVDPLTVQAGELFSQMVAPGLLPDEWDQVHSRLLEIGEPAVPVLAKGLQAADTIERELAATTLALLGPASASAQSELIAALQDTSPFVKANAAAALVLIPGRESVAIPILVEMLNSADPQLRQMAAMNLNVVGTQASSHVAELTHILDNERSPEVLVPVVQLLGRIGPGAVQAVPKLQQIAFDQQGTLGTEATSAIHKIRTAQ